MMRWLSLAVRTAVVLAAVLCIATATATPLVGQQAADAPQAAGASASQTNSARTDLPGPRVRADFPRVEPAFAGSNAPSSAAAAAGSHTFTITTLALVLVVIIAVLLIAK